MAKIITFQIKIRFQQDWVILSQNQLFSSIFIDQAIWVSFEQMIKNDYKSNKLVAFGQNNKKLTLCKKSVESWVKPTI